MSMSWKILTTSEYVTRMEDLESDLTMFRKSKDSEGQWLVEGQILDLTRGYAKQLRKDTNNDA